MIKDGVIVDTSLFIDFLRGERKNADAVAELLEKNLVLTTGIIIAELLQGMKNTKEEEQIVETLSGLPVLEITAELWIKTGKMSSGLRKKGINLPLTDVAIAMLAIENDLEVYTLDAHFQKIPGVKIFKAKV